MNQLQYLRTQTFALTQTELADKLECSQSAVSKWEKGKGLATNGTVGFCRASSAFLRTN